MKKLRTQTPNLLSKKFQLCWLFTLLLLVIPNLIWIFFNRSVWPWDQAWYGEVSTHLFYGILDGPRSWFLLCTHAMGFKAPLIAWFGQVFVPLGQLVGSYDQALLLSILCMQVLALFLFFKVMKDALPQRIGLVVLSGLIFISSPLFIGMGHQYLVESHQTLVTVWFLWIAWFCSRWSWPFTLLQLIAAGSFGMLAKVSSPLYCFVPGLFIFWRLLGPQPKTNPIKMKSQVFQSYFMVSLAGGLGVGALLWYGTNWRSVVDFLKTTSSGDVAQYYGHQGHFVEKIVFWFASFNRSFFAPYSMWLFVLSVILMTAVLLRKGLRSLSKFDIFAYVSLAQISLVLVIFSFQVNEETRYLLPILPYVAILVIWPFYYFRIRIVDSVVGILFLVQWGQCHAQAMGWISPQPGLSVWLWPIHSDSYDYQRMKSLILQTCIPSTFEKYSMIGVELPTMNANSASYFSAKYGPSRHHHCYYTSLGYAENNTDVAWKRMLDLKIHYFITLKLGEKLDPSDPFNRVSKPILEKIERSGLYKRVDPGVDLKDVQLFRLVSDQSN